MPNAPISKRLLAGSIDLAIFMILFLIVYLIFYFSHETFYGESGAGYILDVVVPTNSVYLVVLVSWTVFIILTEYKSGQSIGKRFAKIKVVRQDSGSITFLHTFIRHLFDIADLVLLIGLFVAMTNKESQRIGDLVAKTIVVTN